jgi:4'-phosphopantetheinyl transferase
MPLLLHKQPFPNASFGLWLIEEDPDFFQANLSLEPAEAQELALLKGLRRLEWLTARWLLDKMSQTAERLPLAKDSFSKPFFPGNDRLICSLSHSQGKVGVLLLELDRPVDPEKDRYGCDIQVLVDKIRAIAPKFTNEAEKAILEKLGEKQRFEALHLLWTAKESLYKAYGLKSLDFRANIFVEGLEWDGQQGKALGRIQTTDYAQAFDLYFEKTSLPEKQEQLIWTVCRPC